MNRILLFLILLIGVTSCNYQDVEVLNVTNVEFKEFSKNNITVTADVKVNNPNSYKISVVDSDVDIYLAGQYAGKAKFSDNIIIPANYNDDISIQIEADLSSGSGNVVPIMMSAMLKRSVHLRTEGYVKARRFLFSKKVPLNISEEVRL